MSRRFAAQYLAGSGGSPVATYPFSISAQYKPTATAQDATIVGLGNGTDRYAFYQNQGGIAMYSQAGASAGVQALAVTAAVSSGLLVHVGGVVASSTSRKVYVNGVLGSTDSSTAATGTLTATFIGAAPAQTSLTPSLFGNGEISEVGIWDVELTAEEWAALGAGCSPLLIRPQNLKSYWPLLGRATNEEDWVGTISLVNPGGVVVAVDQPRIIYPSQRLTLVTSTATPGGNSVSPSAAAMVLSGYAPTISQPKTLSPIPAAIALTGYAPSIAQPKTITPAPGALALTGYAPTISQAQAISPTPAAISLAGYAPSITQPRSVSPAPAAITLTGYAPSISQFLIIAPPFYGATILSAAPLNGAVPPLSDFFAADAGTMRSSNFAATILSAAPINGQGRMSATPIYGTANLL